MQKGFSEVVVLLVLSLIIVSGTVWYRTRTLQNKHVQNKNSDLTYSQEDPAKRTKERKDYEEIYLHILTTELTKEQHDTFYDNLNLQWARTNPEGWTHTESSQNNGLYVKDNVVCSAESYWCGSINYEEEKQRCLQSDIDLNDPKEWKTSGVAICCHSLVSDKQYAFGCTSLENSENYSQDDYQYTLQLLKENGVDCDVEDCPDPFENETIYYKK